MDLNNQIIIYQTEDGQTQVDVRMENDMIWLTRQQIAVLFGRDYKTISKHINNALKEELADSVVVAKFANTTQHGAMKDKTQTHELIIEVRGSTIWVHFAARPKGNRRKIVFYIK